MTALLRFLPARSILVGLLGLNLCACATTPGVFETALNGQAEFVDLSHPVGVQSPIGADAVKFEATPVQTIEQDGHAVNRIVLSEAMGTHIEGPAAVVSSGTPVDKLPASLFLGYGAVIDVKKQVEQNPAYEVTRSDLESWEADNGPIPPEAILLVRTGWSSRYDKTDQYLNRNDAGKLVFPGLSAEALDFLVRERRIHAIGIDTPSVYAGGSNTPQQRAFLNSGKFHIHNLTRLDLLPPKGASIIAMPMKLQGAGTAPARVIAIMPPKKTEVEPGKKKVEQNTEVGGGNPGAAGGASGY